MRREDVRGEEHCVTLTTPFLFDENIGYWTGEPDWDTLSGALTTVPQDPRVEREVCDTTVRLRGPQEAVLSEAAALREAGLE